MKKYNLALVALLLFTHYGFAQEDKNISEGNRLFENGEIEAAKKNYKEALKENKESIPALRALSEIEVELENWGDLKDWSDKILKLLPNDIGANYYHGIAHRETGKFKATLLRKRDFGKSEKYFDTAIQDDSLYKDVFLQRALLERRREKWQLAILYGHRQIKVKPDLAEAQIGLFKLYRLYLINGDRGRMVKWLQSLKNDWADFFTGEYFRRYGNLDLSNSVFQAMLNSRLGISRVPVFLALVRLNVQIQDAEKANTYYLKALDSIHSKTDALLLFEDIKYVLTDDELSEFRGIDQVEKYRTFFEKFWLKRELIPASAVSYRVLEHYRRLLVAESQFWYDGIRSRINNPDKFGDLDFPAYYQLNEEFNDKGLIYIRHGDPSDIAKTSGESVLLNESWLYYKREDREKLVFHFLVSENTTGNNWRLSSAIDNRAMLADRLGWDPSIQNVYYAKSDLDFFSKLNRMASKSMDDVKKAMASDYHTWTKEIVPLTTEHQFAYFKGDSGKTEARVYIAWPLNHDGNEISPDSQKVEFGSAIVDKSYSRRLRQSGDISLIAGASATYAGYYLKDYSFDVTPGKYKLSYFVKCGPKLGGENIEVEVPAFSSSALELSSLVPAYWMEMPEGAAPETSNLKVTPNPSKKFKLTDPIFLYYEVYNLAKDAGGETDYTIESELAQAGKKSGIKNLFGLLGAGGKKVVSLNDRRTGEKANVRESISFDVSKLNTGGYDLKIKVIDNISKQSTLQTVPIYLNED